jgi:GNAT superfamily N-acetyltransferase
MLEFRALTGPALDAALDDVARLRITVFRAFPYLYDGDLDYERNYLSTYAGNDAAILVGAFDGSRLVGAATGTPMEDHEEDLAAALAGWSVPVDRVFYCAESVLLPEYRGQKAGHAFFDLREAHARALGRTHTAFCAVIRPGDHPDRPADYRPLDPFWRKRGYAPLTGAIGRFRWKDLGETEETEKHLQFWTCAL